MLMSRYSNNLIEIHDCGSLPLVQKGAIEDREGDKAYFNKLSCL